MDAGQTWTAIDGSGCQCLPAASTILRTALAENAAGTTLYASFAPTSDASGSLYSTTDGGTTWVELSQPCTSGCLDWYRDAIAVSPTNPLVLYASGAGLYELTDGGKTWNASSGQPVYADQHAFAFSKDGSRMYLADDGGIFVTTDPTDANASFTSLNTTMNTMTFYPGSRFCPESLKSLLAGSQDHGVNLYLGELSWPNGEQSGFCGDGGSLYVDPQGLYAYAHCQGGAAHWAANPTGDASTTSWVAAQNGINPSDPWPWVADIRPTRRPSRPFTRGPTTCINRPTPPRRGPPSLLTLRPVGDSHHRRVAHGMKYYLYGANDGTVSVTHNALTGTAADVDEAEWSAQPFDQ